MRSGLRALVIAVGIASCGAPAMQKGDGTRRESVISDEEIAKAGQADAFTTVQVLRPTWLQIHGRTSISHQVPIQVYVDGSRVDGVSYLSQIPAGSIASIRHMDELEATNRYGLDHGAGAILVFTKRGN